VTSARSQRSGHGAVTGPQSPRPGLRPGLVALWLASCGAVVGGTLPVTGCFSPEQPACAFSCAEPPNRCPESYTCGDDLLCHRTGAETACPLSPPHDGSSPADAANASVPPSD